MSLETDRFLVVLHMYVPIYKVHLFSYPLKVESYYYLPYISGLKFAKDIRVLGPKLICFTDKNSSGRMGAGEDCQNA